MNKVLLSVYDYTGEWAKPYIDAGWRVILWDKKLEGCILEGFTRLQLFMEQQLGGARLNGVLFAPPCTDFSSSGARWWQIKDGVKQGYEPFDSSTELSIALVLICLHIVDVFKPSLFWVLENPVGRIERLVPEIAQYRKFSFNPSDFGDPYTKKTILWGEFNANLVKRPVLPLFGSLIHSYFPSPDRQAKRSVTPSGFAKAFYEANH